MGNPRNRPHPILVQLNSLSGVHSTLRAKLKMHSSTRFNFSVDLTITQRIYMMSFYLQLKAKQDIEDTGSSNILLKFQSYFQKN